MNRRRLLGRLLGAGLVVAAIVFVGLTIAENADALRTFDWRVRPGVLALSVVLNVVVLAFGVLVLHRVLLHTTSDRVPLAAMLRLWFLSAVARYIPGKVWQFVAAAQLAGRGGFSGAAVLTAMAIHIGFTLVAAVLVSLATLPIGAWTGIDRTVLLLAGTVAGLAVVHPAVLRFALRLLPRALHRDVVAWGGGWGESVLLLALCVISWLLGGLTFILFVSAIVDVAPGAVIPLIGVNTLSFVAGYVVLIAPAGLGVREAAMTELLGPFMPAYVAAVLAVLSRLWLIAAELIGAALAFASGRR